MTTDRQKDAARANGAKSRGPITAEGKQRSSQNSLSHGLTASTILLPGESEHRFNALLTSMLAAYAPASDYEASLIEKMAALTWQQDRLLGIDTETLNTQIQMMAPALAAETENLPLLTQVTLAYRELSDTSRVLPNLDRHASRIRRQFNQLRTELLALQKNRTAPDTEPQPSGRGPDTLQNEPTEADSSLLASDSRKKLQNEPTGEQPDAPEQHTSPEAEPGASSTAPTGDAGATHPRQSDPDPASSLLTPAENYKTNPRENETLQHGSTNRDRSSLHPDVTPLPCNPAPAVFI
ncbi:MAG: hypothetical protein IT168_04975 [Bryobacterales bacterium]|nr:hypothetical protein [Bryobacterales bacterium]